MSIFKLTFTPTTNATRRRIIECSDTDFVIIPNFLPIDKMRRLVGKYEPKEIRFVPIQFPNVLHCHDAIMSAIRIETIERIASRATRRFPLHEHFYLITKPEGIDLHSFAAWVNSLKPL